MVRKLLKNLQKKLTARTTVFLLIILIGGLAAASFLKPLIEGFGAKPTEIVLYHMNGCGHCEKFMPEWDKFEKSNTADIVVRKLESSNDSNGEIKKNGVSGFPTVLLLDAEKLKLAEFKGERTESGLKDFVNNNL